MGERYYWKAILILSQHNKSRGLANSAKIALNGHKQILEAIFDGDPEGAQKAMAEHLDDVECLVRRSLEEFPEQKGRSKPDKLHPNLCMFERIPGAAGNIKANLEGVTLRLLCKRLELGSFLPTGGKTPSPGVRPALVNTRFRVYQYSLGVAHIPGPIFHYIHVISPGT